MRTLALICAVGSFIVAALSLSIAQYFLSFVCIILGCIYLATVVNNK